MSVLCDLHTHSTFSDGTDTPEQLLSKAEQAGLGAVALTDHNTVKGLPDFLKAAQGKKVRAIAGTELSSDYNGIELHILGLFLQPEQFDTVTEKMEDFHRRKEQSNLDLVERLNKAGYSLNYASIKAATPEGQVNRALIAAELLRLGYVESIKDAFKRLLKPECGYYTPPYRPSPEETVRFLKSIGAVAVLAHPLLNLDEGQLRQLLPGLKEAGLDAMETIYATYTPEETAIAKQIAEDFGLLESGGSDYHGNNKPHIQIGVGQGSLAVPQGLMTALEERQQKK